MTPDEEAKLITPTSNAAGFHTLGHALTRMGQRISAGSTSVYTWLQARIAERQPIEVIRHTGASLSTRLREPLFWFRLIGPTCMLMAGMLRMAEPDTWLGSFFASRFEAAKIGYRTILQDQPPTLHDLGFQEILELALASDFPGGRHYVRDYMEKEKIGKIQTIIYGKSQSYIGNYQGFSTAENPFRTPFSVRLEDETGKGVTTRLSYTESDLKERLFMPTLKRGTILALVAGFGITILLLLLPTSKESQPPMRKGTP